MDPSKAKMGKLAQKFNLSQSNRSKKNEQAAAPGSSGQGRLPSSQSHPVQLPGSQVLRFSSGFDVPMGPPPAVDQPVAGPRSCHARSLGASPGFIPTYSNSSMIFMDVDNPDIPTPEQLRISDLEQRLRVATGRIRELEDEAREQAEELMVAKTQSKIDVDQEVIRLQQEVQTLEQHEDRLISELVSSETKLKGLESTKRDLKKRLSHFHTIYCLKHVYNDHLKKMSVIEQRTAKDLHEKFQEAEIKYMEEAFALYDYLEANGLQDTLPDYAKAWLANPKGKKS